MAKFTLSQHPLQGLDFCRKTAETTSGGDGGAYGVMTNGQHKGTIMVVDDDRGAMEALSDILEYEGYQVQRAQNGLQALEHLQTRAPAPISSSSTC